MNWAAMFCKTVRQQCLVRPLKPVCCDLIDVYDKMYTTIYSM